MPLGGYTRYIGGRGVYKLVLYNAVAIRPASLSNSRMPGVRQIARFCVTNSTKTSGETVLQICTLNFYSQCQIGSFFGGRLAPGEGGLAIVI